MNRASTKLILITTALLLSVFSARSADLYVDDDFGPGTPGFGTTAFASIGSALAVAGTGDAILIHTGVYAEQVLISTALSITAVTGEDPVMDGTGGLTGSTGITVTAAGVNISGITIRDYDYGIVITASGQATVDQCRIFDNDVSGISNQNISLTSTASDCWWGASSGPFDGSDDRSTGGQYNPNGMGNAVSDYVIYYPWSVNSSFTQQPVEFGLYNTGCETLEVRLKPLKDINSTTTIVRFTVRWAAGTVNLTNVSSPVFNISLNNLQTNIGGYNYAIFFSDDFTPINIAGGDELPIVTFEHDGSGSGFGDFEIAFDAWTVASNADPYLELMGTDYSGYTYHMAENVYLDNCDNAELQARVLLEGAYDSLANLMRLDINPDIPLSQPYVFPPWGYYGSESLSTVPANMVDWVLVELRSAPGGPAVDRTAGLLMSDGMILNTDLDGSIRFDGITSAQSYYVVVHHRNHLPVMSLNPVAVPNLILHNFADTLNFPPYGTGKLAMSKLESGVYGMISGDVNNDGVLKYSGPQNDRGLIMNQIYYVTGAPAITQTIEGYYDEDLTMNKVVKYSGPGNDQREIILNLAELTGSSSLNTTFTCVVPGYASFAPGTFSAPSDFMGPVADIGIFEGEGIDELVLKVRPDHDINNMGLTNIQFTISWPAGSSVYQVWPTASLVNSSFNIQPQGPVTLADGYFHQVFAAANGTSITWIAGTEYPVLTLRYFYSSPDCTEFELSHDAWTLSNNGVYYFEVVGQDRTGIRYQALAQIISEGGFVSGGQEICLGTSTGIMVLTDYSGNVTKWQRSHNGGSWNDIPGTAGLVSFSDVPPLPGTWDYRAEVQKFGCTPDFSDPASFSVAGNVVWTGNTDSDWDDAGNWNACGVPTILSNVIIPDVTPRPFPIVTIAGYCKTLLIETGASVRVNLTGSITVGNMVLDGGTVLSQQSRIINNQTE